MNTYKHKNGRIQHRERNGKFRKTTLSDLGIPEKEINKNQKMICPKCRKSCMPILLTTIAKTCSCGEKMIWLKDFDFDTR